MRDYVLKDYHYTYFKNLATRARLQQIADEFNGKHEPLLHYIDNLIQWDADKLINYARVCDISKYK